MGTFPSALNLSQLRVQTNDKFIGRPNELVYDICSQCLVMHDGITPGGCLTFCTNDPVIDTDTNAVLDVTNSVDGDGIIVITVTPQDGSDPYELTLPEPTIPETDGIHYSGDPVFDPVTGIVTFPTVNDLDESPADPLTLDLSSLINVIGDGTTVAGAGDVTVVGNPTDGYTVSYNDDDILVDLSCDENGSLVLTKVDAETGAIISTQGYRAVNNGRTVFHQFEETEAAGIKPTDPDGTLWAAGSMEVEIVGCTTNILVSIAADLGTGKLTNGGINVQNGVKVDGGAFQAVGPNRAAVYPGDNAHDGYEQPSGGVRWLELDPGTHLIEFFWHKVNTIGATDGYIRLNQFHSTVQGQSTFCCFDLTS